MTTEQRVQPSPLAAAAGLSRVLVERTRMAMREPAYSYSLYVAEAEAPDHCRASCTHFTILSDFGIREQFIDYANATRSAVQCAMPTGWDRYQAWLEHEQHARRDALILARLAFPELEAFPGEALPSLWITMPRFRKGTHANVWLIFGPEPDAPGRT